MGKDGASDPGTAITRKTSKKREMVARIQLLNDEWMQVTVRPKLLGSDLFSMAASRFTLHEKEPFGLLVKSSNPYANQWVDMDTYVLDQPFAKTEENRHTHEIKMSFRVRYFGGHVTMFREFMTQKLFFYQAKRDIYNGVIQCPRDTTVQLCALALQVLEGDYLSDSATRNTLENSNLLPDQTIVQFGHSLETCAEVINNEYRKLAGMSEASAVLGYMTIVQQQPTYGVHFYEVKDSTDRPYLLGIGPLGIAQYDVNDTHTPRKSWEWLSLTNVSWKKCKFFLDLEEESGGTSPREYKYVWRTSSPLQSDLMLKMVHFQHTNSLRCERITETRRREDILSGIPGKTSSHTSNDDITGGDNSSVGGSSSADQTGVSDGGMSRASATVIPAAHDISIPSAATSVTKMLNDARATAQSTTSPLTVHTFSNKDATGSRAISTASLGPTSTLDALERRRDQILAELTRKRKLVEQYDEALAVESSGDIEGTILEESENSKTSGSVLDSGSEVDATAGEPNSAHAIAELARIRQATSGAGPAVDTIDVMARDESELNGSSAVLVLDDGEPRESSTDDAQLDWRMSTSFSVPQDPLASETEDGDRKEVGTVVTPPLPSGNEELSTERISLGNPTSPTSPKSSSKRSSMKGSRASSVQASPTSPTSPTSPGSASVLGVRRTVGFSPKRTVFEVPRVEKPSPVRTSERMAKKAVVTKKTWL